MKASELRDQLDRLIVEHGDGDVFVPAHSRACRVFGASHKAEATEYNVTYASGYEVSSVTPAGIRLSLREVRND